MSVQAPTDICTVFMKNTTGLIHVSVSLPRSLEKRLGCNRSLMQQRLSSVNGCEKQLQLRSFHRNGTLNATPLRSTAQRSTSIHKTETLNTTQVSVMLMAMFLFLTTFGQTKFISHTFNTRSMFRASSKGL